MPKQKFLFSSIFLVLLSALFLGCSSKTPSNSVSRPETPEKSMSISSTMTQGEYPKGNNTESQIRAEENIDHQKTPEQIAQELENASFGNSTYTLGEDTYTYFQDSENLTDVFTISQPGKPLRKILGPLSQKLTEKKRSEMKKCIRETPSICGEENYRITRVSPRGRYIELAVSGFESSGYSIFDVNQEKIVYFISTGVVESRWTPNNEQLVFVSLGSMGNSDIPGVYVSKHGQFPAFDLVLSYTQDGVCENYDTCIFRIGDLSNTELTIRAEEIKSIEHSEIKNITKELKIDLATLQQKK